MTRYGGIISSYQDTLAELDKITGMAVKSLEMVVKWLLDGVPLAISLC